MFTFDENAVYTQQPSIVSTAGATVHPGYLNRNDSYIREVSGDLVEETAEGIDDYTRLLLHRVKEAAPLSEAEYGTLLKMIECGELKSPHEVLESSLLS